MEKYVAAALGVLAAAGGVYVLRSAMIHMNYSNIQYYLGTGLVLVLAGIGLTTWVLRAKD